MGGVIAQKRSSFSGSIETPNFCASAGGRAVVRATRSGPFYEEVFMIRSWTDHVAGLQSEQSQV